MLKRTSARLPLLALLLAHAAACSSYPSATSKEAMAPPPSHYAMAEMTAAPSTEAYQDYGVNPLVDVDKDRFSTFAIDVDTASYAISRRKLVEGALPPVAAVRVEEFVNAFDYAYEAPTSKPFAVHMTSAPSPFVAGHHVLRVGLQAKRPTAKPRVPAHLVYLVDTSGSMQSADKLGLVKKSLKLMTEHLKPGDTVALCTYAGSTREVLPPTGIEDKAEILDAIEQLTSSGGTAMSSGMDNAYALASRTLKKGHINRVIVLSDGDANIGPSSHSEILDRIAKYKEQGITLSTVGFGQGNYKDTMMEQLANKGDGNYFYIDGEAEAKKVFVDQLDSMLEVVAKDVKVQVEFDPKVVKRYRLIGYENRDVADKDFANDKVDGGEVGAGHSVTALYDLELTEGAAKAGLVTVRVRYKSPEGGASEELAFPMEAKSALASFGDSPRDLRLATAIAGFADALRGAPGGPGLDQVLEVANKAAADSKPERELIELIEKAIKLGGPTKRAQVVKE
jgi:Ca-activated chloride channel family protein